VIQFTQPKYYHQKKIPRKNFDLIPKTIKKIAKKNWKAERCIGRPWGPTEKWETHGYPLGILQISVLKANAPRQEVYRRKLVYFCIVSNKNK
jgi:hypothetical protein